MKSHLTSIVAVVMLTFAILTQLPVETTVGQEKAATTAPKDKAATAKVAKKPSGRLPAYYGKVGLSDEQRTDIYEIQSGYRPQIADLQKQIDSLKAKQAAEVAAVLTAEQKKKLAELLDAAKARRAKRKSS